MRLLMLLLTTALFATSLGVVFATHQSRKLFVQLQKLEAVRDALEVDWGRLQLEQSTWATDGRIEKHARERLNMQLPPKGAVVIVRP